MEKHECENIENKRQVNECILICNYIFKHSEEYYHIKYQVNY